MSNVQTAERKAFRGNFQLAWDSTSLGIFKECPRKYQLAILEGWTGKALNIHLTFGILVHECLEAYDRARAEGQEYEDAVRVATRRALEGSVTTPVEDCPKCGKHTYEVALLHSFDPAISGSPEILSGWHWYCTACHYSSEARAFPRPLAEFPPIKTKTRYNLVRTIVWYLDYFKDDPLKTITLANGKPAVELSFRFELPLDNPFGEPYLLSGHLDRLVEFGGDVWVNDRKTTGGTISTDFFSHFSPDNQMSLYTAGSQIALSVPAKGVIIDGMQIAVNFSRFQRGFVTRTNSQMIEWLADTHYWIKQAEARAAEGRWPMNDKSCGNYGGCPFRGICGKDPAVRQTFLQSDFHRSWWDPLEPRGT